MHTCAQVGCDPSHSDSESGSTLAKALRQESRTYSHHGVAVTPGLLTQPNPPTASKATHGPGHVAAHFTCQE
eukprot:365707-Chlamydomonas_euryale.AAC.25